MSPKAHRDEYARRMDRVIEHIDRHLDDTLALETLADVANFSRFHFHRLFAAWMGETLGEYLRRRRLEMAALRLATQPDTPVLHVALSVRLGSAEAFARAFKTRFGCTPSAWRTRRRAEWVDEVRNRQQANSNLGQAMPASDDHHGNRHHAEEVTMKVKLIDRQPATVVYLRHVGPYGRGIAEFWQQTVYPWMVTNQLLNRPRYGISHDDPGITAPAQCRYDAAVEVPSDFLGAGPHLTTQIPGGRFASAYFKGTVDDILPAWAALLRDWLPAGGLQLDARPFFEYYPEATSYDPATGIFDCELHVPVTAL